MIPRPRPPSTCATRDDVEEGGRYPFLRFVGSASVARYPFLSFAQRIRRPLSVPPFGAALHRPYPMPFAAAHPWLRPVDVKSPLTIVADGRLLRRMEWRCTRWPASRPRPISLIDVDRLRAAYYDLHPEPDNPAQAVSFGTSGHRGTSLDQTFNDDHIAAISQAIAEYRKAQGHRRPALHRHGHPRALRAGHADRARGLRRERGACHGAGRRRLHARRRSSRMPSSPTTGRASAARRTASSSPRRTTHRATAASSTIRHPAARPTRASPRSIQDRANEIISIGPRAVERFHFERAQTSGFLRAHDYRPPLRRRPAQRHRHGGRARRRAAAGLRSDGRQQPALLGAHRRDLQPEYRGRQRRTSTRRSRSCRSTTTARSAWTAPRPTPWPGSSGSRTASTWPGATTPTRTGTASSPARPGCSTPTTTSPSPSSISSSTGPPGARTRRSARRSSPAR